MSSSNVVQSFDLVIYMLQANSFLIHRDAALHPEAASLSEGSMSNLASQIEETPAFPAAPAPYALPLHNATVGVNGTGSGSRQPESVHHVASPEGVGDVLLQKALDAYREAWDGTWRESSQYDRGRINPKTSQVCKVATKCLSQVC